MTSNDLILLIYFSHSGRKVHKIYCVCMWKSSTFLGNFNWKVSNLFQAIEMLSLFVDMAESKVRICADVPITWSYHHGNLGINHEKMTLQTSMIRNIRMIKHQIRTDKNHRHNCGFLSGRIWCLIILMLASHLLMVNPQVLMLTMSMSDISLGLAALHMDQ